LPYAGVQDARILDESTVLIITLDGDVFHYDWKLKLETTKRTTWHDQSNLNSTGTYFTTVRRNLTCRVHEVATQKCVWLLQHHGGRIAWSPTDEHVFAHGSGAAVWRCNIQTKEEKLLDCFVQRMPHLDFSSDGRFLFVVLKNELYVFFSTDGTLFKKHTWEIDCISRWCVPTHSRDFVIICHHMPGGIYYYRVIHIETGFVVHTFNHDHWIESQHGDFYVVDAQFMKIPCLYWYEALLTFIGSGYSESKKNNKNKNQAQRFLDWDGDTSLVRRIRAWLF
jgi:hypothetical protein